MFVKKGEKYPLETNNVEYFHFPKVALKGSNVMKRLIAFGAVLTWTAVCVNQSLGVEASVSGQATVKPEKRLTEPTVVERGAHHRIWRRFEIEMGPDGKENRKPRQYTELGTGLHYQENGEWKETKEEIEIQGDVAVASKGPHKVKFAPNLNSAGAIEVTTPDGKTVRSHVLGLSYDDPVTGKAVVIAEVKDCVGKVIPPNQVIYEDAFTDGIKADVRLTYKKSGIEQDVILRAQPPVPEVYGLNSSSARLQVLTEFLDAPVVRKKAGIESMKGQATKMVIEDSEVEFGSMRLIRGRAFSLDEEAPKAKADATRSGWSGRPGTLDSVPVGKQVFNLDGRTIMAEEVSVPAIRKELEKLPSGDQTSHGISKKVIRQTASKGLQLPALKTAKTNSKPMQTASIRQNSPGYVLDYVQIYQNTNALVFQADCTYYISSPVLAYGDIVVEGGTVIKFDRDIYIEMDGNVICKTAPYCPAIITGLDDDSVGENISGSTGEFSGYYAAPPFYSWSSDTKTYHDLRFLNASYCIYNSSGSLTISNCQFVNSGVVLHNEDSTPVIMHNCLLYNAQHAFQGYDLWNYNLSATHLTLHNVDRMLFTIPWYGTNTCAGVNLRATNSLFVNVTNWGGVFVGKCNGTNYSDSVFQIIGGGKHYLATNSIYRDVGTTEIGPFLLAQLAERTTYPPIAYTNATFNSAVTFWPQAMRDTNGPDLGYHYDPMDWVVGDCYAEENVTVNPGTSLGWFMDSTLHGLHMADQKTIAFNGTVEHPTYWVRHNTSMECADGELSWRYGTGGITGSATNQQTSAQLLMQYTRCSIISATDNYFRDDYGYLTVRINNSEFNSGGLGGYVLTCSMTNCLFYRTIAGAVAGFPGNEFLFRNCTWIGGWVYSYLDYTPLPFGFYDCAFDGTVFDINGNATFNNGYNAYLTNVIPSIWSGNPTLTPVGNGNQFVDTFSWQVGPLGRFYLPTNSPLIDAGSVLDSSTIGLQQYTTQVDQTREWSSPVDIGYHYPALDQYGALIDRDMDGLPDVWEMAEFGNLNQSGTGDYDGDGISNYKECVRGGNPTAGTTADTGNVLGLVVHTLLR